jgi:hypothetical protein
MFNIGKLAGPLLKAASRSGLVLKRFAPEILTGVGVVGVVVSTVFACKATLSLSTIVEEAKEDIESVKDLREEKPERYSEEASRKDLAVVYTKSAVAIFKLYAPAAALGVFSIACILGGQHILRKENAALTMAYAGLAESFKKYRERVRLEQGEEKDRQYLHGIVKEDVIVQDEDGNTSIQSVAHLKDPNGLSEYARIFGDDNRNCTHNPELNLMFLRQQQNYANDMLHARGHIFLNEVYDMLGFERTEAGNLVGWVDAILGDGDGFVDFGIYDPNMHNSPAINGKDHQFLLDFNVDGIILDIFNKKMFEQKVGVPTRRRK